MNQFYFAYSLPEFLAIEEYTIAISIISSSYNLNGFWVHVSNGRPIVYRTGISESKSKTKNRGLQLQGKLLVCLMLAKSNKLVTRTSEFIIEKSALLVYQFTPYAGKVTKTHSKRRTKIFAEFRSKRGIKPIKTQDQNFHKFYGMYYGFWVLLSYDRISQNF